MTRQINQAGRDLIQSFERLALIGYRDQAGVATNGWGHTGADVFVGQVCTKEKAETWWNQDIAAAEAAVENAVKVPIGDNQFAALVSFAFNCGCAAFEGSGVLRSLNAGNYSAVPMQLALWNKFHNHDTGALEVSNGLVRRRAAEIALWATHDATGAGSPVPAPVSITPAVPLLKRARNSLTILGASAAGASVVLQQAAAQIQSLEPMLPTLHPVFLGMTLSGIFLSIWGRLRVINTNGV